MQTGREVEVKVESNQNFLLQLNDVCDVDVVSLPPIDHIHHVLKTGYEWLVKLGSKE